LLEFHRRQKVPIRQLFDYTKDPNLTTHAFAFREGDLCWKYKGCIQPGSGCDMAITDKERAINRNVLRNRCALVLVVGVGQNKRDHLLIQYAMILAAFSSHDVSHPRFGVFPTRKAPRFASEPGRLPNSPPPELLLLNIESEPERVNGTCVGMHHTIALRRSRENQRCQQPATKEGAQVFGVVCEKGPEAVAKKIIRAVTLVML